MILAGLAALVFTITGTGSAWAQLNTSGWLANFLSNGVPLESRNGYQEARNGDYLLQLWAADDGTGDLWGAVSTNGHTGNAVRINLPPGVGMVEYAAVAPVNFRSFQIAFTGTNQHIYRASFAPSSTNGSLSYLDRLNWNDTGQLSYFPPALAQGGTGSPTIGMSWIAANDQRHILFRTYNTSNGTWSSETDRGGASWFGPALTFNNGQYIIAHTGDTGQIYVARRTGASRNTWSAWLSTGTNIWAEGPAIAAVGNTIILSNTDANRYVNLLQLNSDLGIVQGWTRTGFRSFGQTNLSTDSANNNIYEIATGEDTLRIDDTQYRDPVYFWIAYPGY